MFSNGTAETGDEEDDPYADNEDTDSANEDVSVNVEPEQSQDAGEEMQSETPDGGAVAGADAPEQAPQPEVVENMTPEQAKKKAKEISNWLSAHSKHRAHGRFISREEAANHGLRIVELEKDNDFQDLLLSVFHTVMMQFGQSDCAKIIENHRGSYFFSPGTPVVDEEAGEPATL